MKKLYFLLYVFYCCTSCNSNEDSKIKETALKDSIIRKAVYNTDENWNSLKNFPNHWVCLNVKANKYYIYEPCDGYIPSMMISYDTLYIQWAHELSGHFIDSFIKRDSSNYIIKAHGYIYDKEVVNKESKTEIHIRKLNDESNATLWKWTMDWDTPADKTNYKWLMIPINKVGNYDTIKNPCPNGKIPEIKFDAINIE